MAYQSPAHLVGLCIWWFLPVLVLPHHHTLARFDACPKVGSGGFLRHRTVTYHHTPAIPAVMCTSGELNDSSLLIRGYHSRYLGTESLCSALASRAPKITSLSLPLLTPWSCAIHNFPFHFPFPGLGPLSALGNFPPPGIQTADSPDSVLTPWSIMMTVL